MGVINKDSLGARVNEYLGGRKKHANVMGVSDKTTPDSPDPEGENDLMDPWNEIHKHLDNLEGAIKRHTGEDNGAD
jgi:hypothetical protein